MIDAAFTDAVKAVVSDAKAAGIPMSAVCDAVGASRATPHRWLKSPPASVRILTQMQAAVVTLAAAK